MSVQRHVTAAVWLLMYSPGCSDEQGRGFGQEPLAPDDASELIVDRFSPEAGRLYVRRQDNTLPGPGEPVDFDELFLGQGLGPEGKPVRYYDLDLRSQVPGKMYVLLHDGEPIEGQLPVLEAAPGDPGYNDFVRVFEVWVPDGYRANSIRSAEDIERSQYLVLPTSIIQNRALVPSGSLAEERFNEDDPRSGRGWYQGKVAHFLSFESDVVSSEDRFGEIAVGLSYIWVAFNINPGEPGGGPPSGAATEPNSKQRHNVVRDIPGTPGYSPLWMAIIYDNSAFDAVSDRPSAEAAPVVAGAPSPIVNCPLVWAAP